MSAATLDIDPDVYASTGDTFLTVNDALSDIVAKAATAANAGRGMAGVDSNGAAWAHEYDGAAGALLRVGSTIVDALGVLGERLVASAGNLDGADAASSPPGAGGPPVYPGSPGTGRAVGVVVSDPPSADGTPADPPPGWSLIAHLLAYVWPVGHPAQLQEVGAGWLLGSMQLHDQADRLSGPIADLAGQTSPEVPYALATCRGLQQAMRTVAEQYGVVAQACTGYAVQLGRAHQGVRNELLELVAMEAAIEMVGAVASVPSAGIAEVPTQAVAGSRLAVAALRIGEVLTALAEGVVTLENLVAGVTERLLDVFVTLRAVTADQEMLHAVTVLLDAQIPPVDLPANEADNPGAHVIDKHVAKSDAYLISRHDKPIASTFTSLAVATTAVSTVIAACAPNIKTWLAGKRPTLVLEGPLLGADGRCYVRESGRFVQPTRVTVRLKRNGNGYFIVTAYPEP